MWAPASVKRVWVFTFELENIARLGGLGNAVLRHVNILSRGGAEVTVFMPSHGRHFSEGHRLRLGLRFIEDFRCCGSRYGLDGNEYRYCLGAYKGSLNNEVKVILFIGLDYETGKILDTWDIYSNAPEKVSLMIRGIRCWLNYTRERPDLIIGNDWHSGLVASATRIFLESEGLSIPYIYFIHLLSSASFPYHYISDQWSGLPDQLISIWRSWRHEKISLRDLWDRYRGYTDLFNIDVADVVASVSYGYMDEITRRAGYWITPKTCVIYNSTDWRIDEVRNYLRERYGSDNRCFLRWRFYIDNIAGAKPCIGHIEPGGFLVVSGGRLSAQKGFDYLARALEFLDDRFKLLVLGITVGDTEYENYLRSLANRFFGRFLVTCNNIDHRIFKSFNYLANVVAVPSRYEPFGLSSVEAQAVGSPVVISRIPGLSETIRDLRNDPGGTGLFFDLEDIRGLALSIEALTYLTQAIDCGEINLLSNIRDPGIRRIIEAYPKIALNIRDNTVEHIDRLFREENTSKMLWECIEKARLYAYYRAHG
ncbi:MAG: glycosyltransferase [Sulfolobales archaeon]